jgi:hypothetical protein
MPETEPPEETTGHGRGRGACAETLDECPETGCAAEGSGDAASNVLKHHIPQGAAVLLTFDDFESLQQQAERAVGSGFYPPAAARVKLQSLVVANRTVSEGDAVRLVGYLTLDGAGPHANVSGESVNCRLKGMANNDFHVPITLSPDDPEADAILVEMIPQHRPDRWTSAALRQVRSARRPVLVEGSLFYDSRHRVNGDPDHLLPGEPKRFTLWELHPVTGFWVCKADPCDPGRTTDWEPL